MFAVNVKGVFLCAQAVARELVKQGHGVILNMSSESGKEGSQGQSAYSATKGAVDSFTRSWAKELESTMYELLHVHRESWKQQVFVPQLTMKL